MVMILFFGGGGAGGRFKHADWGLRGDGMSRFLLLFMTGFWVSSS